MKDARFNAIIMSAEEAFWASVAQNCPEATTGDLDPEVARGLHGAAVVAIEAWILTNATKLPPEGARVRARHDIERYPHFIVPAGSLGTVDESGDGLIVLWDDQIHGCESWDNKLLWNEPEDLRRMPDDIEVVDIPKPVSVTLAELVDSVLTLSVDEIAQAYHATCLAIGMGRERPRDMSEAILMSARDKLRAALEAAGYFRKIA